MIFIENIEIPIISSLISSRNWPYCFKNYNGSHDVYWNEIAKHLCKSEKQNALPFIKKHNYILNWLNIPELCCIIEDIYMLPDEFINNYPYWNLYVTRHHISEEYIERLLLNPYLKGTENAIKYSTLARSQILSEAFMEKWFKSEDTITWDMVFKHQELSEEFKKKHKNKCSISMEDRLANMINLFEV